MSSVFASPALHVVLAVASVLLVPFTAGCHRPPKQSAERDGRLSLDGASGSEWVLEPEVGVWDVSAMGWSADGARLALAERSVVHVVEGTGYREVLRIKTATPRISAVAFSPDAGTLATSGSDHETVLWDLRSGHEKGKVEIAHRAEDRSMETLLFSPDGAFLAGRAWDSPHVDVWTVGVAGSARKLDMIWRDRPFLGLRATGGDPGAHQQMLAFSPDGARLLGVADQALVAWNLDTVATDISQVFEMVVGGGRGVHGGTNDAFHSIAFHPQGTSAAAGTESGRIVWWNLTRGKVLRSVGTEQANPLLGFSRDGQRLAAVSVDGAVRTFAAAVLAPLASYEAIVARADAVALDPDARRAAVAAAGALLIRDTVTGQLTEAIHPARPLSAVGVDGTASRIALGTAGGEIAVVTVRTGALRWLKGHSDEVRALALSDDGRWLASGAADATARIWDLDAAANGARILPQTKSVNAVAVSADGKTVATAGDEGVVHLWDIAAARQVASLEGNGCPILTVRFSPRSTLLAANTTDGALLTWDANTHVPRFRVGARPVCSGELRGSSGTLGFTRDGKWIVYVGHEEKLKLLNIDTTQATTLATQDMVAAVTSVAVSPSDGLVVAATVDGIYGWRLPDGRQLAKLAVTTPNDVNAIALSGDGRFLFGVGRHGLLSVWAVNPATAALTLRLTLTTIDEESGFVKAADSGRVEWLGTKAVPAHCLMNEQVYPRQVCEGRATTTGLLRTTLILRP